MVTKVIGDNTGDDFPGTEDVELTQDPPTPHGSEANFYHSVFAGNDRRFTLIRFTGISSLPSSLTVTAAKCSLYQESDGGGSNTSAFRRALRAWVENEAEWNLWKTGSGWTTDGCLGDATDRAAAESGTGQATSNTDNVYHDVVTGLEADVEDFADGTLTNDGWLFSFADEGTYNPADFFLYTSSEGTDGQRPFLTVTYTSAGGGVTVSPAAAGAVAAKIDPAVVAGAISMTPGSASALAGKADPAVVRGAIAMTPAAAGAVAAAVGPSVVLGALTLTPGAAAAVAARAGPGVVLGSLVLVPAPAGAVAGIADPTVIGGGAVTVTPGAAIAVAGKADPVPVLGAIALAPTPAGARADTLDPTPVLGALTLTPTPAGAVAGKADPGTVLGAIVLTPGAAAAIAAVFGPSILGAGPIPATLTISIGGAEAAALAAGASVTVAIGCATSKGGVGP